MPEGACPLARVFAIAFSYREFARERPNEFGLLAMSMAEPRVLLQAPEDAVGVVKQMISALTPLSAALASAAATGHLRFGDGTERPICLFAILPGVLQLHKHARSAQGILDIDKLATSGVAALLQGWGASLSDVESALQEAAAIPRPAGSGGAV